MVVSNARKKIGFLHISFYKVVQIVLPIIFHGAKVQTLIKNKNLRIKNYSKNSVSALSTTNFFVYL